MQGPLEGPSSDAGMGAPSAGSNTATSPEPMVAVKHDADHALLDDLGIDMAIDDAHEATIGALVRQKLQEGGRPSPY